MIPFINKIVSLFHGAPQPQNRLAFLAGHTTAGNSVLFHFFHSEQSNVQRTNEVKEADTPRGNPPKRGILWPTKRGQVNRN